VAECLERMRKFQHIPYNLKEVGVIIDYITNDVKVYTTKELYEKSLVLEPRVPRAKRKQ